MEERKAILIVDDEVDLVKLLKFRLEKKGYYVVTAFDGEAGLQMARRLMPDLIVLDINMPKKDGFEFYREISTQHSRPKFPILMLTARKELKEVFEEVEADGFMAKPFEIDDLLNEVERIIGKSERTNVFLMDVDNLHSQPIRRVLEDNRYRVSVIETLEAFRNMVMKSKPDFIVMEYIQQDMSGESFIQELKKTLSSLPEKVSSLQHEVPIIVYSYSGLDYNEKSLRAGAAAYIGKPKNCEAIVTALRTYEMQKRAS